MPKANLRRRIAERRRKTNESYESALRHVRAAASEAHGSSKARPPSPAVDDHQVERLRRRLGLSRSAAKQRLADRINWLECLFGPLDQQRGHVLSPEGAARELRRMMRDRNDLFRWVCEYEDEAKKHNDPCPEYWLHDDLYRPEDDLCDHRWSELFSIGVQPANSSLLEFHLELVDPLYHRVSACSVCHRVVYAAELERTTSTIAGAST